MSVILLIWTILCASSVTSAQVRVDPLVRIRQGLVRGQKSNDGSFSTFLGIPYAKVDLDSPFGPSLPAPNFEDIFYAYDDSAKCPQDGPWSVSGGTMTLDCLRLNVYVPSEASSNNPLPVLVWIHGGAFMGGFAGSTQPNNIVKQGVIVVTINYRLGPYGFMCLDTPLVPGNQGLKDQYEALNWVRNNIAAFGGNPYNVTLAGQSAGSTSVLLQLSSTKPKLFHKVIAQSGSPKSDMIKQNNYDTAIKIANVLDSNTTNTDDVLSFLSKTPFELVVAATTAANLVLTPCQEKSYSGIENFLETSPYMATDERKVRDTAVLIGHTSLEFPSRQAMEDPFYTKLKDNFNFEDAELSHIADIVRHFYIGDTSANSDTDAIRVFESDFTFNHPTQRDIHSLLNQNSGPIYEYVFSYTGDSGENGAVHTAEIPYLFDGGKTHNEEKSLVSRKVISLWANFIKYGNPTPTVTELLPVKWKPVSKTSRPYLDIDTELKLKYRVFSDRMAFWDLFYSVFETRNNLYRACK